MIRLLFWTILVILNTTYSFRIVSNAGAEEMEHWATYDRVGRYLGRRRLLISDSMDYLPNSNKIGLGYNPIRGDPVCYTGDCHMSGFGRNLFQLEYTDPAAGSCTNKLIPKYVDLDCIPATEVRAKTQKISSFKELQESTASGVSWSVGAEIPLKTPKTPFLSSLSFRYGQSKQTTYMMNNIYRDESAVFYSYARVSTVKLSLFAPKLQLSDNFRYVIDNLPFSGTYTSAVEKYVQDYIFDYFGITYISELLLGGIAQTLTVIEKSSFEPMKQEGISESEMIGVTFNKAFNFNYNEQESQNSSQFHSFQRYVKSSLATTIGGEIYKNKQELTEWFRTVPDNPVIIKYTIQSIFNLITRGYFPNDTNIAKKAQYIMQALEQYANSTAAVYCENHCTNEAQGVCRSLDAYGYGLCACINGFSGFDCSTPPPPPPTPATTVVPPPS